MLLGMRTLWLPCFQQKGLMLFALCLYLSIY